MCKYFAKKVSQKFILMSVHGTFSHLVELPETTQHANPAISVVTTLHRRL